MKKKILLITCLYFMVVASGFALKELPKLSRKELNAAYEQLTPQYKKWYDMITYISVKEERDVFLSLTTDRDREIFIRSFWQQRDPTPGTVENEYKTEIEQRFAYVENYFKRGSSKPGWMTDMGRYYMILGKPNSISRFDNKPGLFPAQVWYYYGDASLGLPTYFNITFYRPENTTEWKFYNPSMDGPAALLIKTDAVDDTNYEDLYDRIKELAPDLAMPALTMIPNEIAPGYRPPMRNNMIVASIHDSPARKINISYASHFLNYKGYVDLESSADYVENTRLVSISKYERFSFPFINVSLKPQRISLGYSKDKDQYYFSYDLNISLKRGDDFIFEDKKHYDFYIEPGKVDSLKAQGLVIHHSFPAIPGKYTLTVFAMNPVGKEFTYFDKEIEIPANNKGPGLTTPVVGYKAEDQVDSFFLPYRCNNQKLYVDPSLNFKLREKPHVFVSACNLDQPLWETGKLQLLLKGSNEQVKFSRTFDIPLKLYSFQQDINVLKAIGEDGLNPDYYEVEVKLLDGTGKVVDTKSTNFSVAAVNSFAYPMETFNKLRAENPFYFYYLLAGQYDKAGVLAEAETYYARCLANNPEYLEGYIPYLSVLNKLKKYTQVMVEVEKLKGNSQLAFDYHLVKATALYGMKDYKEALNQLVAANKIYDSDTRVLNLLGFTFLNLKDTEEALKAFEASLKLDDKQPLILKTIAEVKQKKNSQ